MEQEAQGPNLTELRELAIWCEIAGWPSSRPETPAILRSAGLADVDEVGFAPRVVLQLLDEIERLRGTGLLIVDGTLTDEERIELGRRWAAADGPPVRIIAKAGETLVGRMPLNLIRHEVDDLVITDEVLGIDEGPWASAPPATNAPESRTKLKCSKKCRIAAGLHDNDCPVLLEQRHREMQADDRRLYGKSTTE